jgi:3-oxoacyl-(acyl-carrier-protein) synthase
MNAAVRIRGAGVVCALGAGASATCAAMATGGTSAGFRGPSATSAAYPAPFDPARDLPRGLGRRLGRQLAMTLASVLDALAGERAWREDPSETGVFAATAHGPIHETVDFVIGARRDGARYASPLLFSSAQHNAMVGVAARELGVRGPALVVSNGEVSFETALLAAVAALAAGRMRRAIVVGADAWHATYARSLRAFHAVTDSESPIDPTMRTTSRGVHMGEGAGALILERASDPDDGPRIDGVALGAPKRPSGAFRVESMATGETRSVARHARALAAHGLDGVEVAHPAAWFGAFTSLSAVAIAAEAARRLRGADDGRAVLFVSAPHDASPAAVVLSGGARR